LRERPFDAGALLIFPASGVTGEHGASFFERFVKLSGLKQQLTRRAGSTPHAATAIFTTEAVFAPELNFNDRAQIWLLCLTFHPISTSFTSRTKYISIIPINLELRGVETACPRLPA
jgi:hypothetical protein